MKYLLLIATLACGLTSSLAAQDKEDLALPKSERIAIVAFIGLNADASTDDRYQELADAGYSHNLWPWFPDPEAILKALDVAKKHDVKVIAGCPEIEKNPAAVVKKIGKHPALEAYYIGDEPGVSGFGKYAQTITALRALDRRHWHYVNLLPSIAVAGTGCSTYQEYLDRFLAEVPMALISFDQYPHLAGSVDTGWYDNFSAVALTAKKANKPFWAFALTSSCTIGDKTYTVTEPAVRLEAYTALAYGAQAIQHFIYWHTNDDPEHQSYYRDSPIEGVEGKRTKTYDFIKALNHEIIALSPVFLKSTIVQIGYVGQNMPAGINPFKVSAPIADITADGRGLLVAEHANHGRHYLIMINRDITAPKPFSMGFTSAKKMYRIEKDGGLLLIDGTTYRETIAPGDISILTWQER
jgi:hypothetical protein